MTRRYWLSSGFFTVLSLTRLNAASRLARLRPELIDAALRGAVVRGQIGGVVAMVAGPHEILYQGAYGKRDVRAGLPMTDSTLFRMFSMTKPATSVAAMQLVEQGRLGLDDLVSKYLPQAGDARVLERTSGGEDSLRPPKAPILVRHLLTHTSGLAYPYWSKEFRDYGEKHPDARKGPPILMFDPGTRWLYGTSTNMLGKVVEHVSGVSLDEYFRAHIFEPLGMKKTFFNVPSELVDDIASMHQRQPDGTRHEAERTPPAHTTSFNGGSGLYGTAPDYVTFMQMILNRGSNGGSKILQPATVDLMARNQIGALQAGRLTTAIPSASNDVDFHPGSIDRFGFGFLINESGYQGGRAKGSLAWAGAANTFFWIDPQSGICAVLLMQVLPFFDTQAIELLRAFERATYASAVKIPPKPAAAR